MLKPPAQIISAVSEVAKVKPNVAAPSQVVKPLPASSSNEAPDFKSVVQKAMLKVKRTPEQPPIFREPTPVVDCSLGSNTSLPLPLATDLIPPAGDFHKNDISELNAAGLAGRREEWTNFGFGLDKRKNFSADKEHTNESQAAPKKPSTTNRNLIGLS